MTSQNRRQITLALLTGSISVGLGGCSSLPKFLEPSEEKKLAAEQKRLAAEREALATTERKAFEAEEQARIAGLSITHPDRKEDFDEWWLDLQKHTTAMKTSDDRILIRSVGSHRSKENVSEQNFLLRAAAETLRAKKDGFVIRQLDYYNDGLRLPSLAPSLSLSSRRWIGNYEDLREDRNEQNLFSSRRKVRNKAIEGVVLLLDKTDFPNRDRFSAADIYLNLLNFQAN